MLDMTFTLVFVDSECPLDTVFYHSKCSLSNI